MDQVSTIMGADENVVEALRTLCDKQSPRSSAWSPPGCRKPRARIFTAVCASFAAYPQYADTSVVAVNTPDTLGCLETGYALAVEALLDTLAPDTRHAGRRPKQVTVLAGGHLTPGDLETLRDWIEPLACGRCWCRYWRFAGWPSGRG